MSLFAKELLQKGTTAHKKGLYKEANEGAIEFTLNGRNYLHINAPKKIHKPNVGDIILFPSSLHHRTIPFTTNIDRIIVSFDLIPNIKKKYDK